jgi:hypothetical protein
MDLQSGTKLSGAYLNQMSQQNIMNSAGMTQAQALAQAQAERQQQMQQQQQFNEYQNQFQAMMSPATPPAMSAAMAANSGMAQMPMQPSGQQQQHNQNQNQIMQQQQQGGVPADGDMSALPGTITEWRRIQDEISVYKQQIRERTKRCKVLQEYIIDIMKRHGIDALALKNSGGRVMFKRNKRAEGLGPKNLEKFLGEYLKSPDQAQAALKYIQERRSIKTTEGLQYDKID